MNNNQKTVLMGAIMAFVSMCLFPPWQSTTPSGISRHLGYSEIWSGSPDVGYALVSVDIGLLFAQWFALCVVAAALYLLFADRKAEIRTDPKPDEGDAS